MQIQRNENPLGNKAAFIYYYIIIPIFRSCGGSEGAHLECSDEKAQVLLLGRRKPTHTSLFSMATVGLVREKSHHSRLSFHAHRGAISAIAVQPQGYDMPPRVFTAGQDGALRMWDGRTGALYVESASLTKHRISCLAVAGQYAYMGTSGGEVIVATTDGTPRRKFMAHKRYHCFIEN